MSLLFICTLSIFPTDEPPTTLLAILSTALTTYALVLKIVRSAAACSRLDGCDTTPCKYVVGSSVYDVVNRVWVVVVCVIVEQVGGEIVHG